ncbi:MAG: hypothetical protein ACR2KK_17345 [Acidimicrobiales bacterium]
MTRRPHLEHDLDVAAGQGCCRTRSSTTATGPGGVLAQGASQEIPRWSS